MNHPPSVNSQSTVHTLCFLLILPFVVSACGGGSDGNSSTESGSDEQIIESDSQAITERLITTFSDTSAEMWVCFDDDGETFSYSFFAKGAIAGFENSYLGSAFSLRQDIPQFQYFWSALDQTTVKLSSPPDSTSDTWTNVQFSTEYETDRLMKATSSSVGQLYCSKESGDRT